MKNDDYLDKSKYWYYFTHYICVLCGREYTYKERRYTPKPNYDERHVYVDEACSDHFI